MVMTIPMDRVGYERLLKEIDKAKETLSEIQLERTRHMELSTSEAIFDNPILCTFENRERQAKWVLNKLLEKKAKAKIVEETSSDSVALGSVVTVSFMEETDMTMTFKLCSTSPDTEEVSIESPLGKAIYGHKVGDIVEYNVGESFFQVRIDKIS